MSRAATRMPRSCSPRAAAAGSGDRSSCCMRDGETLVHRAVRLAVSTRPRRVLLVTGAEARGGGGRRIRHRGRGGVTTRDWTPGPGQQRCNAPPTALDGFEGPVLLLACDQPALECEHLRALLHGAASAIRLRRDRARRCVGHPGGGSGGDARAGQRTARRPRPGRAPDADGEDGCLATGCAGADARYRRRGRCHGGSDVGIARSLKCYGVLPGSPQRTARLPGRDAVALRAPHPGGIRPRRP